MTATTEIGLDDIADALQKDEFVFYYQPKVSMITGCICGAEALIRWHKPDGTVIPPKYFIPLAEATGFINEITLAMFQKLVVDMSIIHDYSADLSISFNASGKDFRNEKLTEHIRSAVDHKLVNPATLELEITETAVLDQNDLVKTHLTALHELGISLAMDDFSTGFSSIDTLSKWPFDTIKLDQGIVSRIESNDKDFTIAQSSIQMAHHLDLSVVAEGIETEETYHILHRSGCSVAQGFWISVPLALHDFLDFIRKDAHWPAAPFGLLHMAQLDHIQWRKALIDGVFYLSNRNGHNHVLRGMPELNCTECRLRKWYYGPGRQFAGTEWYDNLEAPHKELHALGEQLIDHARKNAPKEELVLIMRKLTHQSTLVIGMLQEIENEELGI